MRVLQAGHRFRLDLEAQPFCWAGVLNGADHLQRHDAVGLELPGLVNDRHAAAAQLAQDLVAGHCGQGALGSGTFGPRRAKRGQVRHRFRPPPQRVPAVGTLPKMGLGLKQLIVGQRTAQEPADLLVAQVRAHGGVPFPTEGADSACPSSSSSRRTRSRALYTPESVRPSSRATSRTSWPWRYVRVKASQVCGCTRPRTRAQTCSARSQSARNSSSSSPASSSMLAGSGQHAGRRRSAGRGAAGGQNPRPRCRPPGAASRGRCRGRAAGTPRGPARRPACAARAKRPPRRRPLAAGGTSGECAAGSVRRRPATPPRCRPRPGRATTAWSQVQWGRGLRSSIARLHSSSVSTSVHLPR